MHLLALAQIGLVDAIEQLLPDLRGDRFNSLDQRASRSAKRDEFGPTIPRGRLAVHQPLRFETVKQPRQGWPLDCHTLCELSLGGVMIESRKVQQNQPTGL